MDHTYQPIKSLVTTWCRTQPNKSLEMDKNFHQKLRRHRWRLNPASHMAHNGSYESPVDLSNNKHLSSSRLVKEEVGQGHSSAHSSRHHGYLQPGHSMATPVSVGIPENEHGNYRFLGLFLKTVRFGLKRVILIKLS